MHTVKKHCGIDLSEPLCSAFHKQARRFILRNKTSKTLINIEKILSYVLYKTIAAMQNFAYTSNHCQRQFVKAKSRPANPTFEEYT
jgi:hypothetical protein